MNKSVIVTGANGFLGEKVADKFSKQGYEVHALKNVTSFQDINLWMRYSEDLFKDVEPAAVVNIGACQSVEDNSKDVMDLTISNVICPSIMASLVLKLGIKTQFITIASSWQYGADGGYRPFNLYAASKQAFDDYLEHYAIDGLIATSLILFDTYSASDKRRKICTLIADAFKDNHCLDMTGGDQVLNLVHIEDAANAVFLAFKLRGEEVNADNNLRKWAIKSTKTIQVKELLDIMETSKRSLFNLGVRPYRSREIFEIWNGFEIVPEWEETYSIEVEFNKIFEN